MLQCNYFEVSAHATAENSRQIGHRLLTDLPEGTVAIVNVSRYYLDCQGAKCVWTLFGERVSLTKMKGDFNGFQDVFDIDTGDKRARASFERILSDYSSGIRGELSQEVFVSYTIGLKQRLKAFGKNNCNIEGQYVHDDGVIRIIRGETSVIISISEENKPYNY